VIVVVPLKTGAELGFSDAMTGSFTEQDCVKVLDPVSFGTELSVTVTMATLEPAADGVPLITPVAALKLNPAGNPVTFHV